MTFGALGMYALNEIFHIHAHITEEFIANDDGSYKGKKSKMTVDWENAPPEMRGFVPLIQQMFILELENRMTLADAIDHIRQQIDKLP